MTDADGLESAVSHYEARCMECFWSDEFQTFDGADGAVELHGEFAGCWAAYPYEIYNDGTETRV